MTVAPRARASTAANTRTEAGRSRPAAVLRATTTLRRILRTVSRMIQGKKRRASPSYRWASARRLAPAMACGVRDYSGRGPRGPIVEKRRLRLASCDEALSIITTSPLDCPTASARPLTLILPSGDPWYLFATLATGATRARRWPGPCVATGCTATSWLICAGQGTV
jgi:hypothetical protein